MVPTARLPANVEIELTFATLTAADWKVSAPLTLSDATSIPAGKVDVASSIK